MDLNDAMSGHTKTENNNDESVILEVICDQSLRIWQAFLGTPGGCNGINVLDCFPLIRDNLQGESKDKKILG